MRISRNTFDATKNRVLVGLQSDVPFNDADFNEQMRILQKLMQGAIVTAIGDSARGNTFKIAESSLTNINNFKITGGDGFYANGYSINRTTDIEYTAQTISPLCSITAVAAGLVTASHKTWVVDDLIGATVTFNSGVLTDNSYTIIDNTANSITFSEDIEALGALVGDLFQVNVHALTTPDAPRTDLVYLQISEEEISGIDDPALVDPTEGLWLGDSACRRLVAQAVVRVAEGGSIPADTATYYYVPLATLHRLTSNNTITTAIIYSDDRTVITGSIVSQIHNNLLSLQGGTTAQYYHTTADQNGAIANAGSPSAANPFITVSDMASLFHWRGSVQAAANLPSVGNVDKDVIFVEDDSALYWWNDGGADAGAPYYKWFKLLDVTTAWHDAQHTNTYNDALAIAADVGGNVTIGAHMSDASIHAGSLAVFSDFDAATPASCSVTIPAGTASVGFLVMGKVYISPAGVTEVLVPISMTSNAGTPIVLNDTLNSNPDCSANADNDNSADFEVPFLRFFPSGYTSSLFTTGLDLSVAHTIAWDTLFGPGGSTAKNYSLVVLAI